MLKVQSICCDWKHLTCGGCVRANSDLCCNFGGLQLRFHRVMGRPGAFCLEAQGPGWWKYAFWMFRLDESMAFRACVSHRVFPSCVEWFRVSVDNAIFMDCLCAVLEVQFLRYAEWLITCPVLLIALSNLTGRWQSLFSSAMVSCCDFISVVFDFGNDTWHFSTACPMQIESFHMTMSPYKWSSVILGFSTTEPACRFLYIKQTHICFILTCSYRWVFSWTWRNTAH